MSKVWTSTSATQQPRGDHDALAEQTQFLFHGAEVQHDFDATAGEGYHNGAYNDAFQLSIRSATEYAAIWMDHSQTDEELRILFDGTGAAVPGAVTDGRKILIDSEQTINAY